jgi:hypothetical protein
MASPRERRLPPAPAFRMENPFSVKVLQVFTGAGVGCGVGVGVGRPIYLGNNKGTCPLAAVPSILRIIRDRHPIYYVKSRRWLRHFVEQLRLVTG